MLQFLWLTRLRERWLGKVVGRSRKRHRQAAQLNRSHRPHLELLEDRLVMNSGVPAPVVDPSLPGLISPSPSPSAAPQIDPGQPGVPPPLSGTWTKVAGLPAQGLGTMLLLPNGGVMVQGPGVSSSWFELQPNASGSYSSGVWTKLADMSHARLYVGSTVLPSDKVFVVGGEYSSVSSFDNTGEVYDMATNTWKSTPNFPQSMFGDDPTDVLPNGDILSGYLLGSQTYLYNPTKNTWTSGPTKLDGDQSDEETWVKLPVSAALPQGGILSWSIFASLGSGNFMGQVYNVATNSWIETKNSTTNPPALLSSSAVGYELGGAVLLPNGKVFQLGANGNSAIYDPSTNTWSAGPQIRDKNGNLLGADDAPVSILPDGQVVFSADFGPTSGTFASPTELFDYDYNTNTITQMTGLPAGLVSDFNSPAFIDRTLVLPNGQLLFNDGNNMYVFAPSDSPQDIWRPSISSVVKTGNNSYTLTGLQLSGISEGSSYGDDVNVSENYPIVQLTSKSGQVIYATTSNWSNVLVSPVGDTTAETVNFTLPDNFANGTYQLSVIANGIASPSQTLTIGLTKVQTVAQSASPATFSTNNQTVQLTADVSVLSGSTTVNEGAVTFTVKDKNGNTVGNSVQGTVNAGVTTANFTLPANTPAGTYTVAVSYNDSSNVFTDSSDTTASFTINPAQATINAVNASTTFSPVAQTLTLNANLADASIPTDTVSEGAVTFTVKNGSTILGTVQGAVAGGAASANFTLPAGEVPGNYTIAVSYSDSAGNFVDSGDIPGAFFVTPTNVTTKANSFSVAYSLNAAQTVSLSAAVTASNLSAPATVGEGIVTFTVMSGGAAIGSVNGNVSGGTASANFSLPAGLAAGNYTIDVSYSDSTGNFSDGGDTSGTLTINPAGVTTTAAPANLTFSNAAQTVGLSATVADNIFPKDVVNEGVVTFTLKSGSTVIGNAFANVTNGAASTTFTWSAGRPASNYTIAVSYADSQGNFADGLDTNSTLTIAPASVTTTANNPSPVVSSSSSQNVTLSASVADTSFPSDTVNEGTVTFSLKDQSGNIIKDGNGNTTVTGTVTSGTASAVFLVPGGLAVGNYTVAVSYSDSQGNFNDSGSGDTSGTLTVLPAKVATTANNASAIYSPNGQTLALSASVANTSVPANTVGEGTVLFTITDGKGNPVGTAVGNVVGGTANANFNLPAGQIPGSYTIAVKYSDTTGSGNFVDNGDTGATLTITPAKVTTKANSASAVYSPNAQTLALSATVSDTSILTDTVGEGVVTFTVANGTTVLGSVNGNVTGGTANANFNLPAGQALGVYTITVSYGDSSGNFSDNGDTGTTLTISPANVTAKASSASAVYSPNAQTLALSATVSDTSIPADTVGEGVVTFTVANGTTVLGSVNGNVTGGTANANFSLPGGQAVGNYTISVSYNDSTSHFLDVGDTSAQLTIMHANVTTKANNVSAAFSPNAQTLTLTAAVADTSISSDTVSQGSVTFTVKNGSATIGSVTGLVSGGKANASLSWPAGQPLGNYSISVSYSDSAGNFIDNGDTGATLTVAPASVTTKANNVSSLYSLNAQTLTLSAALTDASVPSDAVTLGVVTFTVQNGSTTLGSVQGTVNNGTASASFTVPAGLNAGSYTIAVSYSDSTGNFSDGGDTSGTLTITPASVTTTASSTNTTFNTGSQTLALGATVTDPGPTIPNVVNEGVVTFTILSGSTVLGSAQGAVNGGTAHASFTLPAALAVGHYNVVVGYSDSQGNFADRGDNNATLAVGTAATAVQLLQANFQPNYTNLTVTETVTAHVASSTLVNRGVVTFVLSNERISANVDGNGNATINLTLPMLNMLNPQAISISYADAGHNLTTSTGAGTASWQWSTPLLPSYAAFNPNSVTMDLFGLFITFTNGVLTEMDLGSTHLVFSYNTSGQLDQVTFDGMNLLP